MTKALPALATAILAGLLLGAPALAHAAPPSPAPTPATPGPANPNASDKGLDSATKAGLGYDVNEFNRRGDKAARVGRVAQALKGDPQFSYLYEAADGQVVIVGQGGQVAAQAAQLGARLDTAAFDPQAPNIDALKAKLQAQVGDGGIQAIGYGRDGYVVVVDNDAAAKPGKQKPEDFAKQFKHVTVKRQPAATKGAASLQNGDGIVMQALNENCSSGFNGTYNGSRAVMTAGHCTYGQTGSGVNAFDRPYLGTVTWSFWGGGRWGTDLDMITGISGDYALPPEVNGWGGPAVTVTGTADSYPGMPVCKSGYRTGWTCGTVDFLGWIWVAMGTIDNGSWVWSAATQNTWMYYGDSGGAWVSGHKAVGTSSAVYDNISYANPVYKSTYVPVTEYATYISGFQVSVWLGSNATFNGVEAGGLLNLSTNQVVSGVLPPLSGDSWSPGTQLHVRVGNQDFRTPIAADGRFTFTYTGPSGQPYLWAQAEYGASTGGVMDLNGGGAQIAAKYASYGPGSLGSPTSAVTCGLAGGGCFQHYAWGSIYWSPATGAHVVRGEIRDRWAALGWETGRLGYPTGDEVCDVQAKVSKTIGCYTNFQGGAILWSPGNHAWESWGMTRARYGEMGWQDSVLGFPTSGIECGIRNGGCYQNYEGGALLWSSQTGAWESIQPMRARYQALGFERSGLGYPTGPVECNVRASTGTVGCFQNYEGGALFSSPAGAFESVGAIRGRYGQLGYERSILGFPTSGEVCGIKNGGCYQNYEGGAILWSGQTGAWESIQPMRARYAAIGFEGSPLGLPTGGVVCDVRASTGTVGCFQNYENGAMFSSSAGAWENWGGVRAAYGAAGYERSSYGFPAGPVTVSGTTATQRYEGGTITARA